MTQVNLTEDNKNMSRKEITYLLSKYPHYVVIPNLYYPVIFNSSSIDGNFFLASSSVFDELF